MEIDQVADTSDTSTDTSNATDSATETAEAAPVEAPLKWNGQKLSDRGEEELNKALDPDNTPDLAKLAKFKLDGKEMSYKDLQNMILSQKKFTQQSQQLAEQRKQFEGQKKYYDNLHADINTVKRDPSQVSTFLKIYPKEFHQYVEGLGDNKNSTPRIQEQASATPQGDIDPRITQKLQELEEKYGSKLSVIEKIEAERLEANQKAARLEVDQVFDKMLEKYPLSQAYENWVTSALQADREQAQAENPSQALPPLDVKTVESYFKEAHEHYKKDFDGYQSKRFAGQKEANIRGKGPGAGGATPGQAPRVAKSIKEASQMALEALGQA